MGEKIIHLVTGATGRTGCALCAELSKRGAYVRALIRPQSEFYKPFLEPYVDEFAAGDVRDAAQMEAAFAGVSVVYHLAGIVSIASAMTAEIRDVNITGAQNVINACLKNNVKRLVHTGTVHTLPFNDTASTLREIPRFDEHKVDGPYAVSKAIGSNLVLDAVRERGLNAVIAMPSGITGGFELKPSNFGQMVRDVAEGRLPCYLKGRYDFVDVCDVARALADLADKGDAGETYIVSGHIVNVKDLIQYAARAAGKKAPSLCMPLALVKLFSYPAEWFSLLCKRTLMFTPYAVKVLGDNCNFSHEKITALTGYAPRSIQESIKEQVDFYFNVYKPRIMPLTGKR